MDGHNFFMNWSCPNFISMLVHRPSENWGQQFLMYIWNKIGYMPGKLIVYHGQNKSPSSSKTKGDQISQKIFECLTFSIG
jgi:hypothetical protein